MSTISVIVANHNYARFLPACIDSVLAQTYRDVELIVVDDGSTDDSRAVLEAFQSRVRVIFQQNQGQAGALNTGVAASSGEIVCLLDADDLWLPHKLERIMATFEAQPRVEWLRHKLALVDEELRPLHRSVPAFRGSAVIPADPVLLIEERVTAGTSLSMRRGLADRVFPLTMTPDLVLDADDTIILARIFEERATGYSLDEVLGCYRKHAGARFSAEDIPRLLRREVALSDALVRVFDYPVQSTTSCKLDMILGALEGAPWWSRRRLGNYVVGMASAARLWQRPKLMLRQSAALSFAFGFPNRWIARLRKTQGF